MPAASATTRPPGLVRAINAVGGVVQRAGLAPSLAEQSLLDAAAKSTGLHDFGPDTFRDGLGMLVRSLDQEARLTTIGRIAARRRLIGLLETRLRLIEYRRRHPGVAEQRITRPIFVLGLPRTGTTVLYGMLAADPAMRSPASWEVARPFPPPTAAQRSSDPRIAATEKEFDGFRRIAPGLDLIHPIGARLPQECLALQAPQFASYEFPTTFAVPGYWDWLRPQNMRDAYRFERTFLQHLQFGHAGAHWLLKTPAHLMWLDALLDVFPDALLVHTHRNPTTVLASVSSLMTAFRSAMSNGVDPHEVGREQLEAWTWGLERAMQVRATLPPDRVIDVHYADTVNDPIGTVGRIYEHFGLPLTTAAEEGVRRYLHDNPRDKHGTHRYSLEDFGLARAEVDAAFASYRDRFDVGQDT
jgi:hypothetical protein